MILSNILMNILMQVFGVCRSYDYITHLSTYTPTCSRANHRLVPYFACAQAGRHSETLQLLFPSHAETKIVEACCNRWGQSLSHRVL